MLKYVLLACALVGILAIVYWVWFARGDDRKRAHSEHALMQSNGTFDARARDALNTLTQIEDPTPGDRFRRGDIVRYNVLEGRVNNRVAVGTMVRDYAAALANMRDDADRDIPADFMVHRIEDLNHELMDADINDDEILHMIFGFNNIVTTRAPVVRQEIIQNRLREAVETAPTRAEAINNYFDAATTYTSDTQNVHDTMVNKDLNDALKKMRMTAGPINAQAAINEASDYITNVYAKSEFNAHKVQNARAILRIIARGETISTYAETESTIFAIVWERCKHEANTENAELMREAVINSLADGIENGNPVCINGRCSRVLNSLVKLDYDKSISDQGAMTFEAYKNQIYQETKSIIATAIENGSNSEDAATRDAAAAYNGVDVEVDPATDARFKNDIRVEIDRNLETYRGKLSDREISNIRDECYVFATV